LAALIESAAEGEGADLLVVFDLGGITGHPDHIAATQAGLAAADRLNLPVVAWAIPSPVADQLNTTFGTAFAGQPDSQIDRYIEVDRTRQLAAIACHHSQSATNPVLWKRLELTGPREPLRILREKNRQPRSAPTHQPSTARQSLQPPRHDASAPAGSPNISSRFAR
jgi:LmbE family N-acetylglucosaminyl deacetylase